MSPEKWDELNERLQRTRFERHARLPMRWKHQAFTLKHAADHLYTITSEANERILERIVEEIEADKLRAKSPETRVLEGQELEDVHDSMLIGSYVLLIGYAIENLLKGILLVHHPEYVTPEGELRREIRTHDLVTLYERCDMAATEEEMMLLRQLAKDVIWQGKYPVPLKSTKMFPQKQPDGSWKDGGGSSLANIPRVKAAIDRLFDKLRDEIERIDPNRDHTSLSDSAIPEK